MKVGRILWILFFKRAGGWIGLHLRSGENPSNGEAGVQKSGGRDRGERPEWGDGGDGVRKSSHKRPKDESQPEQQRMMDRWRKLLCFLCHPALFCFLSQAARTPSVSLTALHHKWLPWLLERNLVASVRVCCHSGCPKWAVWQSFVWTSMCLSSYRLFVIMTLCVCEHGCVWNKASWDFYRNTGCFVECVCHW